jgi:hypothetical protein
MADALRLFQDEHGSTGTLFSLSASNSMPSMAVGSSLEVGSHGDSGGVPRGESHTARPHAPAVPIDRGRLPVAYLPLYETRDGEPAVESPRTLPELLHGADSGSGGGGPAGGPTSTTGARKRNGDWAPRGLGGSSEQLMPLGPTAPAGGHRDGGGGAPVPRGAGLSPGGSLEGTGSVGASGVGSVGGAPGGPRRSHRPKSFVSLDDGGHAVGRVHSPSRVLAEARGLVESVIATGSSSPSAQWGGGSPAHTSSPVAPGSTHVRRPRLKDLEAKWNNRFPYEGGDRSGGGAGEYDALSDVHCTYIRSESFRSSPYVTHVLRGTAGSPLGLSSLLIAGPGPSLRAWGSPAGDRGGAVGPEEAGGGPSPPLRGRQAAHTTVPNHDRGSPLHGIVGLVLKCITLREGLRLRVAAAVTDAPARPPDHGDLLSLVAALRSASVAVVEAICVWREACAEAVLEAAAAGVAGRDSRDHDAVLAKADAEAARPFVFEGDNYLTRMAHDLDFLSHSVFLMNMFDGRLLHNPLLIPPETKPVAAAEELGWGRIVNALRVIAKEERWHGELARWRAGRQAHHQDVERAAGGHSQDLPDGDDSSSSGAERYGGDDTDDGRPNARQAGRSQAPMAAPGAGSGWVHAADALGSPGGAAGTLALLSSHMHYASPGDSGHGAWQPPARHRDESGGGGGGGGVGAGGISGGGGGGAAKEAPAARASYDHKLERGAEAPYGMFGPYPYGGAYGSGPGVVVSPVGHHSSSPHRAGGGRADDASTRSSSIAGPLSTGRRSGGRAVAAGPVSWTATEGSGVPGIVVPHWLAREAGHTQAAAEAAAAASGTGVVMTDDLDFDYGLRRLPLPELWQVVTERTGITKDIVSSLTVSASVSLASACLPAYMHACMHAGFPQCTRRWSARNCPTHDTRGRDAHVH